MNLLMNTTIVPHFENSIADSAASVIQV